MTITEKLARLLAHLTVRETDLTEGDSWAKVSPVERNRLVEDADWLITELRKVSVKVSGRVIDMRFIRE